MNKNTQYIIKKGEKFKGYVQDALYLIDGVWRTGVLGLTFAEYKEKMGCDFAIITDEKLDELMTEYNRSLIEKPSEVSEEDYWHALECLPPCRYDGSTFHISERLTGNIVQWYCQKNGKFYGFTDFADISDLRLNEIINTI